MSIITMHEHFNGNTARFASIVSSRGPILIIGETECVRSRPCKYNYNCIVISNELNIPSLLRCKYDKVTATTPSATKRMTHILGALCGKMGNEIFRYRFLIHIERPNICIIHGGKCFPVRMMNVHFNATRNFLVSNYCACNMPCIDH